MTSPTTTNFSYPKREFLHSKLDEVLRLWHRGSGQGTFHFTVNDGTPNFQSGISLDFEDFSGPEPHQQSSQRQQPVHQPPRNHPHQEGKGPGHARRRRDNLRAAKHQAAKAVAADSAPTAVHSFPGQGHPVGTAARPVLPIPLLKGATFPYPLPPECSTLSTTVPVVSTPTTSSNTLPAGTNVTASVACRDEILSEDENYFEEILRQCGQCLQLFDSNTVPVYCDQCQKCYHPLCGNGHQCLNFFQ